MPNLSRQRLLKEEKLRRWQDQQRELCRNDIAYFCNRFVKTYDPRCTPASIPFTLFIKQEQFLVWLSERDANGENGLAEKSRDVGFTWLCCVYALHCWLFRDGDSTGFGSRKLDLVDKIGNLDTILEKIRFALRNLPAFLRPEGFVSGKHDGYCKIVNPANGNMITGEGGDQIGRGGRQTRYFVDESAFLEHPQLVESSLSATTNVRIDVSTPNGIGGAFYVKRHKGIVPVFTFHWTDDPRKTPEWAAKKKLEIDEVTWAQEYDIDYSASLEGVTIPAAWVRAAVNLAIPATGDYVAGWDIAAEGTNKTVLMFRSGSVVQEILDWSKMNTTQTAWRARDEVEARNCKTLNYDADGIGTTIAGTFAAGEVQLKFSLRAIQGNAPASQTTIWANGLTSYAQFGNLRAEGWWLLRRRFECAFEFVELGIPHDADEMISIPNHAELINQLSMPLYRHNTAGKLLIESKADMKKRGIQSPDFGDACVYAFLSGSTSLTEAARVVETLRPSEFTDWDKY